MRLRGSSCADWVKKAHYLSLLLPILMLVSRFDREVKKVFESLDDVGNTRLVRNGGRVRESESESPPSLFKMPYEMSRSVSDVGSSLIMSTKSCFDCLQSSTKRKVLRSGGSEVGRFATDLSEVSGVKSRSSSVSSFGRYLYQFDDDIEGAVMDSVRR